MKLAIKSVLVFLTFGFFLANSGNAQTQVISDFEQEGEFDQWTVNLTSFTQTQHFKTRGRFSASLVFPKYTGGKDKWPGIKLRNLAYHDWSGFDYFRVSVFNPGRQNVQLAIRIDDANGKIHTEYKKLAPAKLSELIIPIKTLPINPKFVDQLILFLRTPEEDIQLFIDNIRLSNERLTITTLDFTQTENYNNRIMISAEANFPCDWNLNILDEEMHVVKSMTYQNSFEPRWIYTVSSGHVVLFRVIAEHGQQSEIREFGFRAREQVEQNQLWAWTLPSTSRVDPYLTKPKLHENTLSIDLTKGEVESMQLAFLSTADGLLEFSVDTSNFHFKPFREGFLNVSPPSSFYQIGKEGWIPDALIRINHGFEYKSGTLETIWIDVSARQNEMSTGEYLEEIQVTVGGLTRKIRLRVHYYDFELPISKMLKTGFTMDFSSLEHLYPGKRTTEIDLMKIMFEHHITPDNLYRKTPLTVEEVKLIQNITRNKTWTNIIHIRESQNVSGYASITNIEKFLPDLEKTVNHILAEGLEDQYYFYIFDESNEAVFGELSAVSAYLNYHFPDIEIVTTAKRISVNDLSNQLNIDHWCPLTGEFYQNGFDKRLDCWYICIVPNPPYANWYLESGLVESRLIFWQTYQYGISHFLYYNVNRWYSNKRRIAPNDFPFLSWNPQSFQDANGDGNLIYAGETELLPSLRLKNIRDGIDDYLLLKMAEEKLGEIAVQELLTKVTKTVREFDSSPTNLLHVRHEILKSLAESDR